MPSLHLIRHGETTSNVMRRLDTALPGAGLTDFGVRQGIRFGLQRPLVGSAVLVHSFARRAQQTAELIGSAWGLEPIAVEGVHEVQAGDLEDRTDDEAYQVYLDVTRRWHNGERDAAMPGGESYTMLLDRYLPAVDNLVQQYIAGSGQDVYLVSHGTAIRLVAAELASVDRDFAATTHLRNTESIELEYDNGVWVCRSWGSTLQPSAEQVAERNLTPADPMG